MKSEEIQECGVLELSEENAEGRKCIKEERVATTLSNAAVVG